jgi:hypothetical protein
MYSTYLNCFAILEKVRYGIQEHSDALVRGQQRGTHNNNWLISEINDAQDFVYSMVRKRMPGFFVVKASITGVNSVYDLPADYGSMIIFKDDRGRQVWPVDYGQLKRTDQTGSDRRYYKKGETLVLDKDGVTKTYTLWYFKKPRQLHMGRIDTGGTGSCTLDKAAKRLADYYNGAILESIDGDWHDPIADYTAARVATLTNTGQAVTKGDFYGMVSELPTFCHHLIAPRAMLTIRSTSPTVKAGPPSKTDMDLFREQLLTILRDYQDTEPDVDWEQVWGDFAPRQTFTGILAE